MTTTTTNTQKASTTERRHFFKSLHELWKCYHLIYSDESNENFDNLHDSLYCQLEPLGYIADTGEINKSDVNEIKTLLKEVKTYYKTSQNLKEPNWIYC